MKTFKEFSAETDKADKALQTIELFEHHTYKRISGTNNYPLPCRSSSSRRTSPKTPRPVFCRVARAESSRQRPEGSRDETGHPENASLVVGRPQTGQRASKRLVQSTAR